MTSNAYLLDPTRDLEIIRELPITPAEVFAAWTDPESLKHWFTPRPFTTSVCEMDLRPGGGFHIVMNTPEGEPMDQGTGCFVEIVPNEKLVWTSGLTVDFRPQASPMPFTSILELSELAQNGCRYRAVVLHRTAEDAKQHADRGFHDGWGTVVDQLVDHVLAGRV